MNEGSLSIKYQIQITGINGDKKLNNVIDWSFANLEVNKVYSLAAKATSQEITISGHMKDDASMEYQGLSIDGISITVYATQDSDEQDSFGNEYDKDAPLFNPVAVIPGMAEFMESKTTFSDVVLSGSSFFYTNMEMFENTTIHHINVFANRVSEIDENQYMTVHVIDNKTAAIKSTHHFYAEKAELTSLTPKKIISLYSKEEVKVGKGETLSFSHDDDPLIWGYQDGHGNPSNLKGFYCDSGFNRISGEHVLCIDVYTTAAPTLSPEDLALKNALQGKKLSILGDSISTFIGWSNSTEVNDTLGSNEIYYGKDNNTTMSVDDTWWKQTVDKYGMEILVNNSWSGSSVTNKRNQYGLNSYGWNIRPGNLHDNTLSDNPNGAAINPDIIAVYMGTNDLMDDVKCNEELDKLNNDFFEKIEAEGFVPTATANFEEACALMIYKVHKNYPNAEIFCFNNPIMRTGNAANRQKYNAVFEQIADRYGCHIVDLYSSDISNYGLYASDGVHPNARGMDIMTEAFAESLRSYYCK